jgi:hypothetical protein
MLKMSISGNEYYVQEVKKMPRKRMDEDSKTKISYRYVYNLQKAYCQGVRFKDNLILSRPLSCLISKGKYILLLLLLEFTLV